MTYADPAIGQPPPPRPKGLLLNLMYRDPPSKLDWLHATLGFDETGRSVESQGRVAHAEITFGDIRALLERADREFRQAHPQGRRWIGVWVDDPDDCYQILIAKGIDAEPPIDEHWGVRLARVVDPEDHIWALIRPRPATI